MPSKKKKYNARFPAGRIKKIMQTDEEVGKVAQAVPVIISRTLELFVGSLLTKAMQITSARNAKTLSPSHMKQCILSEQRFDFLKDLVKTVQDSSNGEDEMVGSVAPGPTSGLLSTATNKSLPERRKSSKEESYIRQESVIKGEAMIKEETEPAQVVANCSTRHFGPNFYCETKPDHKIDVHEPPLVTGYQPTPAPYQESIIKEESISGPAQVVENCSTRRLSPNFYCEANLDHRMAVHQPPLVTGYQPTQTLYQESAGIKLSPILVMDEDYDT